MKHVNYLGTGINYASLVASTELETDVDCPVEAQHELDVADFADYAGITEKQAEDFWYCFGCFEFLYDFIDELAADLAAFTNEDMRMAA